MSDRGSDPMLPIGTKRAQCPVCKEYFTAPSVFEKHHATGRRQRRCIHPAHDLDTKGKPKFRLTETGHWASSKRRVVE